MVEFIGLEVGYTSIHSCLLSTKFSETKNSSKQCVVEKPELIDYVSQDFLGECSLENLILANHATLKERKVVLGMREKLLLKTHKK